MASVILDGKTFDSNDMRGYGHTDPVKGFFAALIAWVAQAATSKGDMETLLAQAETSNGVSPGAAGNVMTSTGSAWTSAPAPEGFNPVQNAMYS